MKLASWFLNLNPTALLQCPSLLGAMKYSSYTTELSAIPHTLNPRPHLFPIHGLLKTVFIVFHIIFCIVTHLDMQTWTTHHSPSSILDVVFFQMHHCATTPRVKTGVWLRGSVSLCINSAMFNLAIFLHLCIRLYWRYWIIGLYMAEVPDYVHKYLAFCTSWLVRDRDWPN